MASIFDSLINGINSFTGNDPNDKTNALMRFGDAIQSPKGSVTPSAIQEYQYYQSLPPEKRQEYLRVKRAEQWINAGGSIINPGAGIEIPKTLPPEAEPDVKREQSRQSAKGTAIGETEGANEKKVLQAPQVLDLLNRAEKLLPSATSGGAATAGRDIAGFFGNATSGSTADSQLDVIGAALTAGVPRMEGPQSNYDVKLYEKAAGDLANPNKPIETRQSALKTLRDLNEKYAGGTVAAPSSTGIDPNAAREELKRRGLIK